MGLSILINGKEIECQEELSLNIPSRIREPIGSILIDNLQTNKESDRDIIREQEGFFEVEINDTRLDAMIDGEYVMLYLPL